MNLFLARPAQASALLCLHHNRWQMLFPAPRFSPLINVTDVAVTAAHRFKGTCHRVGVDLQRRILKVLPPTPHPIPHHHLPHHSCLASGLSLPTKNRAALTDKNDREPLVSERMRKKLEGGSKGEFPGGEFPSVGGYSSNSRDLSAVCQVHQD